MIINQKNKQYNDIMKTERIKKQQLQIRSKNNKRFCHIPKSFQN